MTDYLKLAREFYEHGREPLEQVQTVAFIAIAEALRPATDDDRIREERQHWVDVAERAIEDRDRAEQELAELRDVVEGADHTAAKYYRRMRTAEMQREEITAQQAVSREEALREAHKMWGIFIACPTCGGVSRETVGMVCQTCGHDYGAEELDHG